MSEVMTFNMCEQLISQIPNVEVVANVVIFESPAFKLEKGELKKPLLVLLDNKESGDSAKASTLKNLQEMTHKTEKEFLNDSYKFTSTA